MVWVWFGRGLCNECLNSLSLSGALMFVASSIVIATSISQWLIFWEIMWKFYADLSEELSTMILKIWTLNIPKNNIFYRFLQGWVNPKYANFDAVHVIVKRMRMNHYSCHIRWYTTCIDKFSFLIGGLDFGQNYDKVCWAMRFLIVWPWKRLETECLIKSVYQDLGIVFVDENQHSQAVQIICWKKCLPLWLHSLQ